ncbi:leucyl/phenylalanyl-tRNA--protein transferase [Marmoricola sp. RAF53]|uniref:leucyl/phenylalanyl-tRNA--protein transferase n=1 Tax=Marmoricola sp. RAF53 TaxID=3233059 RepID=UPI003F9AE103
MPIDPGPTPWALPTPRRRDPDLIAVGGDLDPATLLAAYRGGLFPMPVPELGAGEIGWWSPAARGVLPLDGLVVSRSLRRSLRRYEVRVDTAFADVVDRCADPSRDGAWIDAPVAAAYERLHRLGWAHSVEAWADGELVGGLYGVAVGGLFAGESMFSRAPDASKVALVALVDLLRDEHADLRVLDTQWVTPHLASLGVVEIPRAAYLARVARALEVPLPPVWR